jgi:hypothetical protein
VYGNNARNLSVYLSLSQASKNAMSFLLSHVFSLTKLKRTEQVLPGSEEVGGKEKRGLGAGGRDGPNNVYTYE